MTRGGGEVATIIANLTAAQMAAEAQPSMLSGEEPAGEKL